jgi:ketosteroid isomerase-like protein
MATSALSQCFLLTSKRAKHPLGVSLQRPLTKGVASAAGAAVTGDCREIPQRADRRQTVLNAPEEMKDTADPKITEQLHAFSKKVDDAWNNNDAAALAALFTKDAVLVEDTGPIYGREAIEKHFADVFQRLHFSNHLDKADQYYSPHVIGTSGNEAWSNGEWTPTVKGENFGPVEAKGNWLEIYRREGDTWKKRLDMWNVTPPPTAAATPSPTTTPSSK